MSRLETLIKISSVTMTPSNASFRRFMQTICEATRVTWTDLGRDYGNFVLQCMIDKGLLNLAHSMCRDFAGFLCNLNDFIFYVHVSMGLPGSGFIAPEFRTAKVCKEYSSSSLQLRIN